MIISLLHDSKDIPFWGAYEYGIIPIPFRVVATIAYGVSFSIFSPRHSLNKFGSVHGLAKTFSLIVRRTAVRSYPTQGYALFARVRTHPSPAMDGDATQRRIVPKVIPGR